MEMVVFDRWGREVYSEDGRTVRWNGLNSDGKALPEGVFVYTLRVEWQDGLV